MNPLLDVVARHKAGSAAGVYSVCSAHPHVLEATLRFAAETGDLALIEATSNQVNQDGGYTGLTPAQFRAWVDTLRNHAGLPRERLVLGGDHLGPNPWRALPAAEAMARATALVTDYVAAGFGKIHVDCTMACGGDPSALDDYTIAMRAARLCAASEAASQRRGGDPPVYVIGSEVPVPGGAAEALASIAVTTPAAAGATLAAHRDAFRAAGIDAAWPRVVGLVVQPGVEFDHRQVIDYRPGAAGALSRFIEAEPGLVYEAHSTDYQRGSLLRALVRDHFAILKVGPGLTFAVREALWALDTIAREQDGATVGGLRATVLEVMRAEPRHWQAYYHAAGADLALDLEYSLSDRIRYYWPHPRVQAALERLVGTLRARPPTLALLSQYLPRAYDAVRGGSIRNEPLDLVRHHIRGTLEQYSSACRPEGRAA